MIKRDNHRSLEIVSPIEISSIWYSVSFINEKTNKQSKNPEISRSYWEK